MCGYLSLFTRLTPCTSCAEAIVLRMDRLSYIVRLEGDQVDNIQASSFLFVSILCETYIRCVKCLFCHILSKKKLKRSSLFHKNEMMFRNDLVKIPNCEKDTTEYALQYKQVSTNWCSFCHNQLLNAWYTRMASKFDYSRFAFWFRIKCTIKDEQIET